jgi:hypothetical protein
LKGINRRPVALPESGGCPSKAEAGRALSAGIPSGVCRFSRGTLRKPLAVERLRQRDGRRRLSDAVGTGKNQAGRKTISRERPSQQSKQLTMADDLAKAHITTPV